MAQAASTVPDKTRTLNYEKLNAFLAQVVQDMSAAMHAPLIVIGDKLGLYRAMGNGAPVTAGQLAERTSTAERYVREWLNANAAGHFVEYDAVHDTYFMTPEQSLALAQDDTPIHIPALYHFVASVMKDEDKLTRIYRTGKGMAWHEHERGLFDGCDGFLRPMYLANLASNWIPALDGVAEKLKAGARVADVGCGHGTSTRLMAMAYPRSQFLGFDYHAPSIETARKKARAAELGSRVGFQVAPAKGYPGTGYDLVTFFDCLHDMGDPVGAAVHVRESLAPGGTWMIVEPFAHDSIVENLNPIGRMLYSASASVCVPCSLSQEVGLALGAQAGPAKIEKVVRSGGFTRFRKVTQTLFSMVFEARV